MKTSLPTGILIGIILTALVGCSAGSPLEPSTGSTAAAPNASPTTPSTPSTPATTPGAAQTGVPADVCTKLPLARVNQLTGWDLTVVQAMDPQGLNASECHYSNSADPNNSTKEVFAFVMTGSGSSTFWEQSRDASINGLADLPGVGKRAFTANGTVAVDYGGGFVVMVSDWGSLGTLDIDQARFLVDELHNLYS